MNTLPLLASMKGERGVISESWLGSCILQEEKALDNLEKRRREKK